MSQDPYECRSKRVTRPPPLLHLCKNTPGGAQRRGQRPLPGLPSQNHCPGSINPSPSNCVLFHSNQTEFCHQKVGIWWLLPGFAFSALAARNEHTAPVRL